VRLDIDRQRRVATLIVRAPENSQPSTPDGIEAAGDQFWPLRAFRELDAALLCLRMNEPLIGTVVVKTEGELAAIPNFGKKSVEEVKETLAAHGLTLRGDESGNGSAV
jgi:hypothetical protein